MKKRRMKLVLLSALFVILFAIAWFGVNGMKKTMEKTVSVNVYEDNDEPHRTSSITISGNFRKTWFSSDFTGIFAMESYQPSCREGVEAKIEWFDDYQDIIFFREGDFTRLDVELIEIDEQMESIMVVFRDGTIIATPDHYIPGEIWMQYQS